MRSGKTALTCAKISLLQLFSNPNCILILAVMTIFSFYIYSPMCRISQCRRGYFHSIFRGIRCFLYTADCACFCLPIR